MFDILKIILSLAIGIPFVFWLISAGSGWQDLAEKYKTDLGVPNTFYLEENQRIIFKREPENGSAATLPRLGFGVSDLGLYLTHSPIYFISDSIFPPLLIPWTDISYSRKNSNGSSLTYFTFYLGNPRIASFSLNIAAIEKLEADYGEPIFFK